MSPVLPDPYTEKNNRSIPGAGNYNPNINVMLKTAPNFGFGTSTRDERRKSPVQDPGSYNPDDTVLKRKAPEYKVGTEVRKMFDEKKMRSVPGPGNYEIQPIRDGPSFSNGLKIKDLEDKTKTPGGIHK